MRGRGRPVRGTREAGATVVSGVLAGRSGGWTGRTGHGPLLVEQGQEVLLVSRSGAGTPVPGATRAAADAAGPVRLGDLARGAAALYNGGPVPCGTVPRMTRVRVGLTGGVASGKSTVSGILRELGAVVVDADVLAREVVAPGSEGLAEVVAAFGETVLTPGGELDRPAMGALVFGDEAARRRLEAIIHPRVRARGAELEAQAGPDAVVVHDIPLLAETGQAGSFDAVIVVDVPVETQVERMVALRGLTREDAAARVAAQADRARRRAVATYVIENTGTLEDLRDRVTEVFEGLLGRSKS